MGVYNVNVYVFISMVFFFFSVNAHVFFPCPHWYNGYVFIPMVLFVIKNYQKWVYKKMGFLKFCLGNNLLCLWKNFVLDRFSKKRIV